MSELLPRGGGGAFRAGPSPSAARARASALQARTTFRDLLRPGFAPPAPEAVAAGLVAVGICAYLLFQRHAFTGNHGTDDGVYLAPALWLVHGVLPYRDYAFVQPPGIAWLMVPLDLIGNTRDAMVAARVVTALVAGLNASLAASIVRAYGRAAMLFAGLGLALLPVAVAADHTLTLDPYLVLFCLLGTLALFRHGELATPPRILVAGALFGFAGAVKGWALFPVVAALGVCIPRWRSAGRWFAAGLATGFGLPSLPFLLPAPGAFVHDVVVAQLHRHTTGQGYHALSQRLALMLGLGSMPAEIPGKANLALILTVVVTAFVVVAQCLPARRITPLELFLLGGTAVIVLGMLFVVKEFYAYYAYLPAAFGAMLIGVCLGRLTDEARAAFARVGGSIGRFAGLALSLGLPVGLVVAGAFAVRGDLAYARHVVRGAFDPQPTLTVQIPKGSCVVFDQVGTLIDGNRLFSTKPACPVLVDTFGLWLTDDGGVQPLSHPASAAFVARWRSWLERADFAVLTYPGSAYIPWTPGLSSWFAAHYRLTATSPGVYLYRHVP